MLRGRRHRSSTWLSAPLRVLGILFLFGIATAVVAVDEAAAEAVEVVDLVELVETSEDLAPAVGVQLCSSPGTEHHAPVRELNDVAHQRPADRPPVPPPRR